MSAAQPTSGEMADYMLDLYGTCANGSSWCYHSGGCLKTGPRGRACPYWRPAGWKTQEEIARPK